MLFWVRIIGALGVVAVLGFALWSAANTYVIQPAFDRGVAEQAEETKKVQKQLDDKTAELTRLKSDHETAIANLVLASQRQVDSLNAELANLHKKTAAPLIDYKKQREQQIRDLIVKKGNVPIHKEGEPYFAPIESAGLSKLGVDTINLITQTK
jgi:cell division protein FtsB